MKNVLSFLKPYKLNIIFAYILTFVELATDLLLPFFLGKMINDGVVNQDINNIIMWGSIMLGLALFTFVSGIFNSFYASHVSVGFAYDIRDKLLDKIQSYSFMNLSKYPTSSLVTRFTNDVRQIQNTIFMALRIMSRAPLMVVGGVMMAFIINIKLSLIFLITVPLLIGFLFWVLKRASSMFNRVQGKVDEVNKVIQENLMGMRLIKAFVRRDFEINRFTKSNKALADQTQTAFRFIEASMPILLLIMNMTLVFIIWFGNMQSIAGEVSIGDVVAIVNYALRIAMAISMFTFITLGFSRAKASAERIDEVLSVEVELTDSDDKKANIVISSGKIEFNHVTFSYPGKKIPSLNNISFTAKHQDKIAIIGATGAGKTTLFQLLPRLYDVEEGMIYIDNKPINAYSLEQLRKSIGYVPQNPLLFSGTVANNISWGNENATKEEIIKAAKDAQIHDLIMSLPNQYDTIVSQQGANLSGGQKQRISIARSFVRDPEILMLDDSTSALDLTTESNLLDVIDQKRCTTLFITQKITTAMYADRIMLMDKGSFLDIGSHEELLQRSKLYNDIVESQFGKELDDVYK